MHSNNYEVSIIEKALNVVDGLDDLVNKLYGHQKFSCNRCKAAEIAKVFHFEGYRLTTDSEHSFDD